MMRRLLASQPGSDRGAGSILALAIVAAMLSLLALLIPLCLALSAKQRAAGAADAAALAAADVAVGLVPGVPCEAATRVAAANGAALRVCDIDLTTVTVQTEVVVLGLTVDARATAGQKQTAGQKNGEK